MRKFRSQCFRVLNPLWRFTVVTIWLMSATSYYPVTPEGVHCPTASVQTVTEITYVRDCCGNLVAQSSTRAPEIGEAEFKQCRCAEEDSAQREVAQEKNLSSFHVVSLPVSTSDLAVRSWLSWPCQPIRHADFLLRSACLPPPTPPPSLFI